MEETNNNSNPLHEENYVRVFANKSDCERITREFKENFESRLQTLTEKESDYFALMRAQYGVTYITSKPGVGKSAKGAAIAAKLGMRYLDIRLAMVDETDVGLFPSKTEKNIGEVLMSFLEHIVPEWAWEANQIPTLIHFEELNRASAQVRNAALQLLLERGIGTKFKFNENVYMMASGNLGDEDGTDVEEFDAALNNRLIHVQHFLSADEWIDDYARENVHPDIVAFIQVKPELIYNAATNNANPAFATPRTWTMLSKYIYANFKRTDKEGKPLTPTAEQYIHKVQKFGRSFIGDAACTAFCRFLQDRLAINIENILNNFPALKKDIMNSQPDRFSEWFQSLKDISYKDLNGKQVENLTEFLKICRPEERTGFFLTIVDKGGARVKEANIRKICEPFKDEIKKVIESNEAMSSEK